VRFRREGGLNDLGAELLYTCRRYRHTCIGIIIVLQKQVGTEFSNSTTTTFFDAKSNYLQQKDEQA
jgi:hypothetical protein